MLLWSTFVNRHARARRAVCLGLAALACSGWGFLAPSDAQAQAPRFMVMASTTSTEQSGLFAHLLPAFKQASGIDVRVVALGTGQALDTARRGDADVVFVHDQVAEERFVAEGFGLKRQAVMYNDFILVGPKADPAGVKGRDIAQALGKLAARKDGFVSRGDKSGTLTRARSGDDAGAASITTRPSRKKCSTKCCHGRGPW